MPTSNVSGTFTGTGFSINVTACNLDPNTTVIDFLPFINSSVASTSLFTKTTATSLTYTGASLPASTPIIIQRKTPTSVLKVAAFGGRIASSDWNAEMDRRVRLSEEYTLNGIGPSSIVTVALPNDGAFGVSWSGDATFPPTRNAVYNWGITLAPIASPTFTGIPAAPTAALNTNTTQLSTTAFVQNQLATYAPLASPAFTGTPTCITQTLGTSSGAIASTQFVQAAVANTGFKPNQGRLTLQTGKPVMDAATTSSTLYFTPYIGNIIALYNGSTQWDNIAFSEISIALSGLTVGRPYDVFVFNSGGTATLEILAWTNTTTRATALVRQNGILCKTGALTRRYVGTIYTTSATQTLVDVRRCFLQNAENRVPYPFFNVLNNASYAYTSSTLRQSGADATQQLEVISGDATSGISVFYSTTTYTTTTAGINAIGIDSLATLANGQAQFWTCTSASQMSGSTTYTGVVPLGYHYFAKLEAVANDTLTVTWFHANGQAFTAQWLY